MTKATGPVPLQEALALRDKTLLLKELKQFLDDIKYVGEDESDEWIDGFDSVWLAVEQWVVDKIIELGDTVKESHVNRHDASEE